MTESSAILTCCSTKSKPSGPEYVAYNVRKRAHSSVGALDNDCHEISNDTYALKRRGKAISFQVFTAHFNRKNSKSADDSRERFAFRTKRLSNSVRPYWSENIQYILPSEKHHAELVMVTITITELSAILTRCSTMSEPSPPPSMCHISQTTGHIRQLVPVRITTGTVNGPLTPCSAKIRQSGPKYSFVIRSYSCTDTVPTPHLLLGLHVGISLDQSLDNLRVPIHGSPDQGRPARLRDEDTSPCCSRACTQ
jgi:hypothetical protein